LGSEDGLNSANIFNVEQHENGLMYFTTSNGIYYYDGYAFSKLEIDSLKSNTLLNVVIKNSEELLLSIRDEGIARFNLKSKRFELEPNLKYKNNADNFIITEDFAYLLTSEIKLITINLKTGEILADEWRKKDRMNLTNCIFKTRAGKILVGRTDGLYDATSGKQVKIDFIPHTKIHSITQTKDGRLILGTPNKIIIVKNNSIEKEITPTYETKSSTFEIDGGKSIDKLVSDDFGRIWFTSYPDENLYLYQDNKVYDVFEILDIPPTLITCIFKDAQQNIWVGTFNDGVYFIQNPFFSSINFSFNNKNLNINQVYLKNNMLVAATSNGLFGLNLSTHQAKILSKPDVFGEPINGITELNDVMYYSKRSQFNMAPAIFLDSKNTYKFKPIIARQFYPINNAQSIVADWEANILLCNTDGNKTLDTLISFSDYKISVNAFLKRDNLLYVGTNNGLFVYDFKTKKYKNFIRNELNFNINDVAYINSKVYVAHEAGITDVYERKLIQQIGQFRLNTVKKIKQFNNQIWLATLDGVFICNQNLEPLKVLNKSNGLLSNTINDIAFNNQIISIATARGIATTEFENINSFDSKLKPVTINYISSNGDILVSPDNNYRLNAAQENISIYFYSPFFNKPNKQFFKYKLDKGEWKNIENLSLSITLLGGSHKIEIAASADNIVWSDSTSVEIYKEEKLTEKQALYWLITIGSVLLIVLISFIWIRRVKIKSKKRLQEEQEVNLLKHQAMNSLLSPHFIFNSLTSIQNYINTNNGLRASEYLAKFSRLIRMIIEKAAQSEISLYDELARLTYYLELEKERFKNKFDYSIIIDEDINTHEILIPNMIIQPHVENCIIHGILPKHEHGVLIISFKRTDKRKFLITIEDNGIGIIKAKEHIKAGHKSLGTSTIQNILDINSKLSGKKQKVSMVDKSTINPNESGTIITIELEQ
jgi:ligand-binding sensor domain-containing protein/two-component sensor histidine kinase